MIIERAVAGVPVDAKAISERGEFAGYASVFGVRDSHRDIVERGAFVDSLAEHERKGTWPVMLATHDMGMEIGEWTVMREDDRGLYVEGRLWVDGDQPDPDALRVHRSMRKDRGRPQMSIGYHAKEFEIDRDERIRRLKRVDLIEVSVLPFGASNPEAVVTNVKAADLREMEALLRDGAGLSGKQAKASVSLLKPYLHRDDADEPAEAPRDEGAVATGLLASIREIRLGLKS